jgi:hypothetical protein
MTKNEKVANIIAFLTILFGKDNAVFEKLMDFSPDYIIEKFDRYVLSMRVEYPWGMHPSLKNRRFNLYTNKWRIELKDE